jgi:hypothetical protein
MKVKGPTNGAPPVDRVDEVAPLSESEGATGAAEVSAPAPATGAGSLDPVAQVAAQLRAGEISVDQAVDRLIDDAISRQLGHQAPADLAKLEPKLRELLRSYAESDPFLAARIRRLTLAK